MYRRKDSETLPMSVAQIRTAVMRKLNLMDIDITHIEEMAKKDDDREFDISDTRLNPEQLYINKDFESKINNVVEDFMWKLSILVKHKRKQYKLVCNIVYVMYLTNVYATQLDVSKILGVSDALVSGYRKSIEPLLKKLEIHTIIEAKLFEQALRERIKNELSDKYLKS